MNRIFLFALFFLTNCVFAQIDFDRYKSNKTFSYEEINLAFGELEREYPEFCKLQAMGPSDSGEPIYLFLLNAEGKFEKSTFSNKSVILINNAIHPGEPCGVDASLNLANDLLKEGLPNNVVIGIIPMYNVGGALNRNCCSRANQNGPEMYGFRGNAKNLDLNRDYIKADSKNTLTFYRIYNFLEPHVFIDTHTSNGADYQHVMTLITSQIDKMNPVLKKYTQTKLNPHLFKKMEEEGYPMVPYMHTYKKIPDFGVVDFMDSPRYSSGYTNLFNTLSFVSEAHMLKSYPERVEATYALLRILIEFVAENKRELIALKHEAENAQANEKMLLMNWQLDTLNVDSFLLKGYAAKYKKSDVTGVERLYYDRNEPYEKYIPHFNHYIAQDTVSIPDYYLIPQAWDFIIPLFSVNQIPIFRFKASQKLETDLYRITNYTSPKDPYEGHYLHRGIEVQKLKKEKEWRKGDYLIPTNNKYVRFVVETLEPKSWDSYLAWNYFDAILQQKEWFSAYVFEDEAAKIIRENPEIKIEFEKKKRESVEFANDSFLQLYYLYQHSGHYEPTHNLYPVGRFNGEIEKTGLERLN